MKIFREKYTPEDIEINNLAGEKFVLKSKFLSSKQTRDVEKMMANDDMFNIDKIHKMMIMMFGKDTEFWAQFSMDLLADISKYMADKTKKNSEITVGSTD